MVFVGYNELRSWEEVFSDVSCVRVMLYLAKYNPNRHAEEISKKLSLSKNEVGISINKLMEANMINMENDSFTLKNSALIGLNNFVELTNLKL